MGEPVMVVAGVFIAGAIVSVVCATIHFMLPGGSDTKGLAFFVAAMVCCLGFAITSFVAVT